MGSEGIGGRGVFSRAAFCTVDEAGRQAYQASDSCACEQSVVLSSLGQLFGTCSVLVRGPISSGRTKACVIHSAAMQGLHQISLAADYPRMRRLAKYLTCRHAHRGLSSPADRFIQPTMPVVKPCLCPSHLTCPSCVSHPGSQLHVGSRK